MPKKKMENPTDKIQTKPTRMKLINFVVSKAPFIITGTGRLTNVTIIQERYTLQISEHL